MSKKNNTQEEKLLNEINEQFKFSKRYLDQVHERFNRMEELYRSFIDKTNYPHHARVFDPRVFRVIETVTPRMVANEPTGSFYPAEQGDEAVSQILNALIKYDWRKAEMFPKLVSFVKSMLIFGTAFGRTYWDFQETDRTRMIPKQVDGRVVWTPKNKEQIKVTVADNPNFEVLNIYDCFPDPNATNLKNMRWFIYRTFKTLDELKQENETRGVEYWKNLDVLEEAYKNKEEAKAGGKPSDLNYREHRRMMLSTEDLVGQDNSNPEIVVLRRFTREGWVDICPEYGVVIRECENPYFHGDLPIIYGVDYPYPGELYGMGEVEPVERIQRAINAVLNQRLDNVQLVLRNMWKVKKNSGVDLHTLVSAPGNIITTNDMTAVEPVVTPDVTGGSFVQTMNYLTAAMQNGSGITDYTVGVGNESVANKTATGTRLIQQEANAQFKLKIQLFNNMVIERIANHFKDLRVQYTTEKQKLRIIGEEFVKEIAENTKLGQITETGEPIVPGDMESETKFTKINDNFAFLSLLPEDIQPSVVGDYDFIVSVDSEQLTDPIAMQENFFMALDKVSNPAWTQGLAQQGKMLDYNDLTLKVFEKLKMGIDSKKVVTEIPQPQNSMDQIMQEVAPEGVESPIPVDMNTGELNLQEPDLEAIMNGQLPVEGQGVPQ